MTTFNHPLTQRIAAFLQGIGLEIRSFVITEETFLPGIEVRDGGLLVDEAKLLYPGDLLHEAGHLAVLPRAQRSHADGELIADTQPEVIEVAAIAWSYAAALHLELDPALVFHANGYRGNAAGLLMNFQLGVYPGAAALAAIGLTFTGPAAQAQGLPVYPHMRQWLCD